MLRPLIVLAVVTLALACAPAAAAEDLAILVERTAPTGSGAHVVLVSDVAGLGVEIEVWRLSDPPDPAAEGNEQSRRRKRVGTFPVRLERAKVRQGLHLPLREPGLYLLEAGRGGGGPKAKATLLVSDLALVTKRHPGGILIWSVNRKTGAPWRGVRVAVHDPLASSSDEGVTDAQGLLRIDGAFGPAIEVRGEASGHRAFGPDTWFPSDVNDRRVYVFPHQPAYRPGERIELKGIVRAWQDGRLHLDPGVTTVEVTLLDARAQPQGSLTVPVDPALGTFAAGFDVDAKAVTGSWHAVATIGDATYQAPVRVAAYRRPAFEVRVAPEAVRLQAGGKTAFAVQASWYDGGPLEKANVTWQLFHNRVDRDLFPTEEMVRLFFGSERTAFEPVQLAEGTGVLDDAGTLRVEAQAPPEAVDGWLSLRAIVTGPDRLAVSASGGCAVAAAPLRVGLETDKHLYGAEDVVGVRVRVERADGRPAQGRAGVLKMREIREDIPNRRMRPPYTRSIPFTTDAQGTARVDVALPGEGRFRLEAVVGRVEDEPAGEAVRAHLHVWAAADQPTLGLPPGDLEVVIDKDHHAVGDTARVLVRAPGGYAILASLEGPTLLQTALLQPTGGAAVWPVRIEETHAPNVYVTFAIVHRSDLRIETRMLRIPPITKLLTTTIEPDAPQVEPGAKSGATVRVTDAAGRPVANAEVSLAVVDDALHGLYPDPAAGIEAFFHPTRRNGVRTGGPLHHDAVGVAHWPAPKTAKRATAGSVPPGVRTPSDDAPPPPATPMPQPSPSLEPPPTGGAARGEDGGDGDVEEELEESESGEEGWGVARGLGSRGSGARGGRRAPPLEARADFRACVYWKPALRTDAEGRIRIETIAYADSLTRWRLSARTVDAASRVGTGVARVVAKKNVSVRLATPRFLRVTDRVTMPVLLRNLTDEAATGTWFSEASSEGGNVQSEAGGELTLMPRGTQRETLSLIARAPGTVHVRASVRTDRGSDAEIRDVPILPQGIERVIGLTAGSKDGRVTQRLVVPPNAVPGTVRARISVEPSHAAAVAAALPYLAGYPHGCTEQTLHRFLPVLAAADAMAALKVPPVGLLAELPAMIEAGLQRLRVLQHEDGGFGWWPTDASDAAMTALVLRGLNRAQAHLKGRGQGMRKRAARWLAQQGKAGGKRRPLSAATEASVLLALAGANAVPQQVLDRTLAAYAEQDGADPIVTALLLQAAAIRKRPEGITALKDRLEAQVQRSDGLAFWVNGVVDSGAEGPSRWEDDAIEGTAEVLYALLDAGADEALLADGARWLVLARVGGDHWRSTRDAAAAVRFLAAYTQQTGDLGAGTIVEVLADGEPIGHVEITRENLFAGGGVLPLPAALLEPSREIALELRTSRGTFTAGVHLSFFETGPAIQAGDSGLRVTRRWYLLEPRKQDGRIVYTRTPLSETVPSGALVESELEIASDKAREYVMVTDPLAAGFEPEREVGMQVPGRKEVAEAQIERYDDRTLFFVTRMPAGTIRVRHTLRATHVGAFTALPAQAELMYFPHVRGNGDGEVIEVSDAGPAGHEKGGAK